ncbi:MAG TPA: lysylphosphatidylglycerol synthase domain-containing protein [bacterium]|nr:lysylphosphatidylglycerol synthase domain-containing protein [bacterium]
MGQVENQPGPDAEVKKPSLASQLVPYVFTAVILVYVFTGLSSNVVDERYEFSGTEWTELKASGVKKGSVAIKSIDGTVTYCEKGEAEQEDKGDLAAAGCPAGGDFEFRPESNSGAAAISRTAGTRIPDHAPVSVNYVKKVKMSDIWALVRAADLRFFLPLMVLHCFIFFMADVLSFGMAYKFFNVPDIKFRELMECRGAPYVIQVGLAVLAEVFFPLYMLRVKKVPVTESVSSNLWSMIMDLTANFTVLLPAVIYNLHTGLIPAIGPAWLAACIIFWALFLGNVAFWHSPLRDRAMTWIASGREGVESKTRAQKIVGELMQLLRTFSLARWNHYLRVWAVRMVLLCSSIASSYAALRAMGVDPPLPLALIVIPVIVISVFLPIGVGGYGGPQLIAWFLIVSVGKVGTADQVIAFSLLWSTGFLIGRAVIGMIFIRGFWKRCFPEGFKL